MNCAGAGYQLSQFTCSGIINGKERSRAEESVFLTSFWRAVMRCGCRAAAAPLELEEEKKIRFHASAAKFQNKTSSTRQCLDMTPKCPRSKAHILFVLAGITPAWQHQRTRGFSFPVETMADPTLDRTPPICDSYSSPLANMVALGAFTSLPHWMEAVEAWSERCRNLVLMGRNPAGSSRVFCSHKR